MNDPQAVHVLTYEQGGLLRLVEIHRDRAAALARFAEIRAGEVEEDYDLRLWAEVPDHPEPDCIARFCDGHA